ncbi:MULTISPECIES: helix-turn-helix domain-containing protein [Niastella]|uniref:Helix-turn-helix transcriptional regulator n=1 Tax=Niastella soli TaxID=2821487 RepID=A0ABS3Z3A3_9BACT|nr:AraC family transcriptional regulator [Niastella soli]MBO9204647.1 helix-turn-helix transcriptional regulator [Niastella soli]
MQFSQSDFETIQQVKELLEKEFKYQHAQTTLARRFHINESKLRKGFVLINKIPIYEYIVRIRIEKAKELLACTDKPVKMVACQVGYHLKSLEKQFRKLVGMSPLEWRKIYTDRMLMQVKQKPERSIV